MQTTTNGIVFLAALALAAAGWIFMPALQRPERKVDAEVADLLEESRNYLYEYQHGLASKSILLDNLAASNVDVDFETEGLAEASTDRYQQSHAELWEAFPPHDYAFPDPPIEARARYGNIESQIAEGVRTREEIIARNRRLLDDALRTIDEALGVQSGSVSARTHAEANRLRGIVQYHKGIADRFRSRDLRNQAASLRMKLDLMGIRAAALAAAVEDRGTEGVDARIADLKDRAAELEAQLATRFESLADVDARIDALGDEVHDATAAAKIAMKEMEGLRERGVDFSDPQGGRKFASTMEALSGAYRQAMRIAIGLEFGTLTNAEIDHTGDYVNGQYVAMDDSGEPQIQYGLQHFRFERSIIKQQADALQQALSGLRGDIAQLESARDGMVRAGDSAADRLAEVKRDGTALWDELLAIDEEATEIEGEAIGLFDQSERSFRQAADSTRAWVSEWTKRAQNLAPENRDNAASQKGAEAGWLAGQINAQRCDALLAAAWTDFDRYHDLKRRSALLERIGKPLGIDQDAAMLADESVEIRNSMQARIESAADELRKAHREAGQHWTFVAQLATVNDLMSLIGSDAYARDAVEAYRAALSSREDEPYTQKLAARLAELEARQ